MMNKIDKIIYIAAIITIIITGLFTAFMVYEFFDMLNDHYCYQLPPQEFINEPKCKKYREDK